MKTAILFLAATLALGSSRRVGIIDFYGYKGLDLPAIRAAVPLHEGDPFDPNHFDEGLFNMVLEKAAGHKPTEVARVCCDAAGNYLLYIGLRGSSYHAPAFHPAPAGKTRLPAAIRKAGEAMDDAWMKAILSGHAEEDDSQGFALVKEPRARARALDYRKAVLREEKAVYEALATASDAQDRAEAARACGFANRSDAQVAALVQASLDPDNTVRNNSIRALEVLVAGFPETATRIPADPFIELLSSGIWTDHNKASILLERLTESRDARLLDQLRSRALDSLIEMARWRNPGHADAARRILGRMVGMSESELDGATSPEQVERIVGAVQMGRR